MSDTMFFDFETPLTVDELAWYERTSAARRAFVAAYEAHLLDRENPELKIQLDAALTDYNRAGLS